jgi:HSP20 family protein
MTLYINPMQRASRRRSLDEIMQDWDQDYRGALTFPIDVKAESDAFTIKALLPGARPEDVNIQIVNEVVTITGELFSDREDGAAYLLAERPDGKFHRVISLPTPLDANKVEADLENGVLTLLIPKAEEAKPHKIKIKQK